MYRIATDRSRIETAQRCLRNRYLEYHAEGTGIVSAKLALPLAVGGSVHRGLEVLLRESQGRRLEELPQWLPFLEDAAVDAALADFATYRDTGLELDLAERTGMEQKVATEGDAAVAMREQLSASLGMSMAEAGLEGIDLPAAGPTEGQKFDDYLYAEQSALVEGMVRAYARRRLAPLLTEFEVLEVEREGEWLLADLGCLADFGREAVPYATDADGNHPWAQIVFLSRPDALLRSRVDNSLYLLSFKTTASWDIRKERDAQHDMQGLSEGIEVERRLGGWWDQICTTALVPFECSKAIASYLRDLPAPPRVLGIRYEYMLKGQRWTDKDLSARFGVECRSQKSHLIRQYVATSVPKATRATTAAYSYGDVCWSWDYLREDGTSSRLAWQNWQSWPVWEQPGGVKAWIDLLDQSMMAMSAYDSTVGMEPREMGWKSPAQALGFTTTHPLDEVFLPPITVFRNDDDLRDLVEQMEAQERRIAESVTTVEAATSDDERRSLLNQHFPQTRRACEYPSTCPYVKLCYGGEEIRREPLTGGLYRRRVVNHPREQDFRDATREAATPSNNAVQK